MDTEILAGRLAASEGTILALDARIDAIERGIEACNNSLTSLSESLATATDYSDLTNRLMILEAERALAAEQARAAEAAAAEAALALAAAELESQGDDLPPLEDDLTERVEVEEIPVEPQPESQAPSKRTSSEVEDFVRGR